MLNFIELHSLAAEAKHVYSYFHCTLILGSCGNPCKDRLVNPADIVIDNAEGLLQEDKQPVVLIRTSRY
jgi:hypothetical protein